MSKINILALGGLDEKSRRLYILEIDSKIYILDSGIYEPLNKDFGISQIVPNINYLNLNKDKIKGIFLSSANKINIGSIIQIINFKEDVQIFGSKVTLDSLDIFFKNRVNNWNKVLFKNGEVKKIGGIDVEAINLPSTIPLTFGYKFSTNDGNVLYLTDYIFDSIKEFKVNAIKEISNISKENNLLLISDSSNSTEKTAISSKFRITDLVSKFLNKNKRFVIAIYEDEIINAIELIELAKVNKRKIFFKSKILFSLLKSMMESNVIKNFQIYDYSEYKSSYKEKSIIVLSGTRTKLFKDIDFLIEEHNKLDFLFEKDDIVYFAALPQPGNEHVFADVTNKIFRIDPMVVKPCADEKKLFGTTEFDIRNMINLLRPKFFMPVSSYFKQLTAAKNIAEKNGIDSKNIIIADNGEVFTINNSIYEGLTNKIKDISPQIIESIGESSIDNELIEERKSLGKNGIVTISFIYKKDELVIGSDIDIQMKGLVISRGKEETMDKIRKEIIDASDNLSFEKSSITKGVSQLKKIISKIFRENFKKIPTIVFNIMEM